MLIVVCVLTAMFSDGFLSEFNIENLFRRTALFGIISIGAAMVIITSGIDLSIGSVVCLIGCLVPWLLVKQGVGVPLMLLIVLLVSLGIGLIHGLLITKLKLQPFIVTLCGLLIYRGVTRGFLDDQTTGFKGGFQGLRQISLGMIPLPGTEIGVPVPWIILLVVAIAAAVFLNLTIYGRYLLALGRNEEAARYSGINTDRMTLLAYVLCSLLSGLGGLMFVCDVGSAQPVDFGNFYELYAIAAAVLGGCSLARRRRLDPRRHPRHRRNACAKKLNHHDRPDPQQNRVRRHRPRHPRRRDRRRAAETTSHETPCRGPGEVGREGVNLRRTWSEDRNKPATRVPVLAAISARIWWLPNSAGCAIIELWTQLRINLPFLATC